MFNRSSTAGFKKNSLLISTAIDGCVALSYNKYFAVLQRNTDNYYMDFRLDIYALSKEFSFMFALEQKKINGTYKKYFRYTGNDWG